MRRNIVGFGLSIGLIVLLSSSISAQTEPCWGMNGSVVGSYTGSGGGLLICPQGDGGRLDDAGVVITVVTWGYDGPMVGIPASDYWLYHCDPVGDINLCGGSASSNADGPSDANGETTISGGMAAGGCADGISVLVQGVLVLDPLANCDQLCVPVSLRSPDLNGDLAVSLVDLSIFAQAYPPGTYERCSDLDANDVIDLRDLSLFALHFGPPSHYCGP